MAEASQIEKVVDRSNAVYTTYLEKLEDISAALITLRNQRTPLQLTFEADTSIYTARILDVVGPELLLENLVPRSALKLMTARRVFAFSGRGDGIYLYAEENQVNRIEEDRGVPYFRLTLPASVLYQQRRRTTRYQPPVRTNTAPATVTVSRAVITDKDHPDTLEGQMLDISAGGCRVAIDGPVHPPLAVNEALRSLTIRIPSMFDLSAGAHIRHASYNKLTRKVICGLEFSSMHITDRRRLEQYIQAVSRISRGR